MQENRFPLKHVSARVPWHDTAWDGRVCKSPGANTSCLRLKLISKEKDDARESAVADTLFSNLPPDQLPPCIGERATFMSQSDFSLVKAHPYSKIKAMAKTHGHLLDSKLFFPSYSVSSVPFAWMFRNEMSSKAKEFGLDIRQDLEPDVQTQWVQHGHNQRTLLDAFAGHIKSSESLVFIYAKEVPFYEKPGRVLIGVGRVTNKGELTQYASSQKDMMPSYFWERMLHHSIRPGFKDGFILPYHALVERAKEDKNLIPEEHVAAVPDEAFQEFSYASELVSHDSAISSLLSMKAALEKLKAFAPGNWSQCIKWIDERLDEIWIKRGPFPGLSSMINALGIEMSHSIAHAIDTLASQQKINHFTVVDRVMSDPIATLPSDLSPVVGNEHVQVWKAFSPERRSLFELLCRFNLTRDQAKAAFLPEYRSDNRLKDSDYLNNPYIVFESSRHSSAPVSLGTVDRGLFPEDYIRTNFPILGDSKINSATDIRRVTAYIIDTLDRDASRGNSLQSKSEIVRQIRESPLEPACPVTSDILSVAEKCFSEKIRILKFNDEIYFQNAELHAANEIIEQKLRKRIKGKRHEIHANWLQILEGELGPVGSDTEELLARQEKSASLEEIANARLSVLIGPAGSGKTTLLNSLFKSKEIRGGGALLLAPTGKARVRMETIGGENSPFIAKTIAQLLSGCGRYDSKSQKYLINDKKGVKCPETVIIDECSMLTEEMLAATLQALEGVQRLILVGDPYQLPPIGVGRPFVDLVKHLKPANIEQMFPKVHRNYAELTVHRRQIGEQRADIVLSQWFTGKPIPPGEDEIFSMLRTGESTPHLQFVQWHSHEDLERKLFRALQTELNLESDVDALGFELSIGGVRAPDRDYCWFNKGAALGAESWQILAPLRNSDSGVTGLNRKIHQHFCARRIQMAKAPYWQRYITQPLGNEEIVYGDKVINVINKSCHHRYAPQPWPTEGCRKYIANGEIGVAVGQIKRKGDKKAPWQLQVEFSSQPGFTYGFTSSHFGEDESPLELAYALTVHKAQGSEFGIVFVVLPDPCPLLSKELLYTALTRQKDKIIILHQGSLDALFMLSSPDASEVSKRITALFHGELELKPGSPEIGGHNFFEDKLVHRAVDGTPLRSKSEVIIYDALIRNGIKPQYELPLIIGDQTRYPDFTIEDDEAGITFYWEHCGMLNIPSYKERWEKKKQWYRTNKIVPHEDGGGENGTLIVTEDATNGGISSAFIDSLIKKLFT